MSIIHILLFIQRFFQWCRPEAGTTTWTRKNNVPCDDGDSCTKSDTCKQGQCSGISFTCNSNCQSCNGRDCTSHTGYGYVAGKCTCKIAGKFILNQKLASKTMLQKLQSGHA